MRCGLLLLLALITCTSDAQLTGRSSATGRASIAPGSTAVPPLPVTNLVAWWEFINSAGGTGADGSTVPDLSGNGNTLTFTGIPNPVNPTPGSQGLLFSQGIASPVVGTTLSISAATAKTILVVFKSQLAGIQGYMVMLNNIGQHASGVFLEYGTADAGGQFSVVPDIISAANPRAAYVPDGRWTFGAIRNAGDATYKQNVNTDAIVTGTALGTLTIDTVWIGHGNTNFVGTVAEVLIYSQSLSDDDLAKAYANLKVRLAAVGVTI